MKRKATALMLLLAMCLSLAACGSSDAKQEGSGGAQNTQTTANPEYVYTASFDKFIEDSEIYFNPRGTTADGYYATSYEKVGTAIPEGVTPEYEGQYDVYQTMLYFVSKDGDMRKLENYAPIAKPENTENYKDFSAGSDVCGIALGDDGKLISIDMVYTSWYEGPDGVDKYSDDYWNNQRYSQSYYIRRLDTDGSEISCSEIASDENSYFNVWNLKIDDKGNVIIPCEYYLRAIDAETGEDIYTINSENYIDTVIKLAGGKLAVSTYADEAGQAIALIDTETKTIGEPKPIRFDPYNCVPGSGEYDLYYTNGTNFFGYKLETGESEKLFNWVSCDVNVGTLSNISAEEDGSIVGFNTEWNEENETYSCERVRVEKKPYDSVPHKEIITIATSYTDYNLTESIVKYNRSNDKYRIELKDYSEYNNEQDGWDAGITKLNTEIMAGNLPDMFFLSGLNYTQLAGKGLLEDLYPYIDADAEISREDFFPNVLEALTVNGKLCTTVSSFSINAVAGAASVVGDEPGWTYDELNAALASMPEGCTVFDKWTTKSDILNNCIALDMEDFVDWSTGKCSFDSEQFIALLEFANSFPAEFDWENNEGESVYDRIAQGRQMLIQTSTYSIDDMMYNDYSRYFGGDITFIGYPTMHGTGNMLQFNESGIAMSAKSQHKDAVWQFMRTFMTEEHQKNLWSIPSNRNLFEKKLEEACTVQYAKDENGKYILDENGEKIPIVKYSVWSDEEARTIDYYAMTEEMANKIRELVTSTTKVANYDNSIFEIVQEQAQAYFEGQRSAQDVAKLIQSKANIFVNEQR